MQSDSNSILSDQDHGMIDQMKAKKTYNEDPVDIFIESNPLTLESFLDGFTI